MYFFIVPAGTHGHLYMSTLIIAIQVKHANSCKNNHHSKTLCDPFIDLTLYYGNHISIYFIYNLL